MYEYINSIIQSKLNTNNEYNKLSKDIYTAIKSNNKIPDTYVIDYIQMIILKSTNRFLLYKDCEDIFFTILEYELKEDCDEHLHQFNSEGIQR